MLDKEGKSPRGVFSAIPDKWMKNLSYDTYINFLLFLPIELKGSPLPHVHSFVVLFRIWEWAKGSRLVHCPSIFSVTYFWYLVHCFLFLFNGHSIYLFRERVCISVHVHRCRLCCIHVYVPTRVSVHGVCTRRGRDWCWRWSSIALQLLRMTYWLIFRAGFLRGPGEGQLC